MIDFTLVLGLGIDLDDEAWPAHPENTVGCGVRSMWGSRRVWQPRLVFWAGAISIRLISVLFALLADQAQALFHVVIGSAGGWRFYLPLAMTPLGFVLSA
ncbi:hypothetical protein MesoLj113c_44250 [Mesorhizobium sp. 113-3-9]|nr:hypothetical protein MesoLj113c_44250 [Mesorhizobium sp. 113-3-9]